MDRLGNSDVRWRYEVSLAATSTLDIVIQQGSRLTPQLNLERTDGSRHPPERLGSNRMASVPSLLTFLHW
jgi:hypothetical protein